MDRGYVVLYITRCGLTAVVQYRYIIARSSRPYRYRPVATDYRYATATAKVADSLKKYSCCTIAVTVFFGF